MPTVIVKAEDPENVFIKADPDQEAFDQVVIGQEACDQVVIDQEAREQVVIEIQEKMKEMQEKINFLEAENEQLMEELEVSQSNLAKLKANIEAPYAEHQLFKFFNPDQIDYLISKAAKKDHVNVNWSQETIETSLRLVMKQVLSQLETQIEKL